MNCVITNKDSAVILATGTLKGHWSNGYPIITDENGQDCAYCADSIELHEVESIPEGAEPSKYCYTPETGFYENPNYVEPVSEEQILINKLIEEVTK